MKTDKTYCYSSYLMFRRIEDENKRFSENITTRFAKERQPYKIIKESTELETMLESIVKEACSDGKAALALSGGIDSAVLARFMPKNSMTYTFKCVVPGRKVTDESITAQKIAEECGLRNKVVEIYWEDMEKYAPILMKHKGSPIHSIEVQIYKASLQAKADGFERLIFGESADSLYGGLSQILSRDWTIGDFIDRYSYVLPYKVLKNFEIVTEPYQRHVKDGYINTHSFLGDVFFKESIASYENATMCAGIKEVIPYCSGRMGVPLDYDRIRSGDGKYLVREMYKRLYPNFTLPKKIPMPRPTNEWFENWKGPKRDEFWENCTDGLTGDQKWLVYCLEKFMDMMDEDKV